MELGKVVGITIGILIVIGGIQYTSYKSSFNCSGIEDVHEDFECWMDYEDREPLVSKLIDLLDGHGWDNCNRTQCDGLMERWKKKGLCSTSNSPSICSNQTESYEPKQQVVINTQTTRYDSGLQCSHSCEWCGKSISGNYGLIRLPTKAEVRAHGAGASMLGGGEMVEMIVESTCTIESTQGLCSNKNIGEVVQCGDSTLRRSLYCTKKA